VRAARGPATEHDLTRRLCAGLEATRARCGASISGASPRSRPPLVVRDEGPRRPGGPTEEGPLVLAHHDGVEPAIRRRQHHQKRLGLGPANPRHPPRTPYIEELRNDHAPAGDDALGDLTPPRLRSRRILILHSRRAAIERDPQPVSARVAPPIFLPTSRAVAPFAAPNCPRDRADPAHSSCPYVHQSVHSGTDHEAGAATGHPG
jgi:hypothetical protein